MRTGARPRPATAPPGPRLALSAVELDVVWEDLGLGPTPVVLALASPGRTHTERRRVVAGVRAGLRARGLAGPGGPAPGLARPLRRLASAPRRVEVRVWGSAPERVLAAEAPDGAVLARRHGDVVALEHGPSLPGAVVGVLPAAGAGPGRAANVPAATLAAALERPSGAGLAADLRERGVLPDEARLLATMLSGVHRRAEVSVEAVDRWGRRRADVLVVLDGPRGRHLVTHSADAAWTTVAPTDARRLRRRVADLLGDAPDQSRSPWRISCRPDSVIEPDSDG